MKTFILALGLAAYAGSSFALPQHTDAIAQAPLVLQPPSDDRIPLALSSSSDVLSPELDSLIEQVWEDWKIPGVGVAVVRRSEYPLSEGGKVQDGWKVEVKGYGWANVIDGTKIDKHSRFAIASNSKQFTALVAGMVVTNASLPELSWETKMRDLVPGWGLKDEWADKEATLVDTLSHRSGLPRHDLVRGRQNISSLVESVRHLRPSVGFREQYQYNNPHFMIAAYVPFFHLATSFADYLQLHIFGPLGMSSTGVSITAAQKSGHMTTGYTREGVSKEDPMGTRGRAMYPHLENDEGEVNWGAGGVIMSLSDAARWLQTLLGNGRHPETGEQVIPADLIYKMTTGYSVAQSHPGWPEQGQTTYGLGQTMSSYRGEQTIEHGGSVPGFKTQIIRFPNAGLGIAVFVNEEVYGVQVKEIIKWSIADAALGLEKIDWNARYKADLANSFNKTPTVSSLDALLDTPPLSGLATPPSLAAFAGIYHDDGYGTIELCPLNIPGVDDDSLSEDCKMLANDVDTILPGVVDQITPSFIINVDRVYTSHLLLTHKAFNIFTVRPYRSLAPVPPDEHCFASTSEIDGQERIAVFEKGGFGMLGGIWGAGEGVKDKQWGEIEERAEVWFRKVQQRNSKVDDFA